MQAVYLLPYAVLAVPLATAAFPTLSSQFAGGDGRGVRRGRCVRSTRLVVVVSLAGAAVLVAVAPAVGGAVRGAGRRGSGARRRMPAR